MDRKIAPEVHEIQVIDFQEPEIEVLANGVELYSIRETDNKTARLDFSFDAGALRDSNVLSLLTTGLILSGTKELTSEQINEQIDALGGYTGAQAQMERATVTIIGLKEHLLVLSKIVVNAILHADFDKEEINLLIASKKSQWKINIEKVATLAHREFLAHIYPENNFGKSIDLEDYDKVQREDIIEFHQKHFLKGLKYVSLVGAIPDEDLEELKKIILQFETTSSPKENFDFTYLPQKIDKEKEGAVQTAIRIGRVLFNKKHKDFKEFYILNTILGGYFGSRLMTSIREEKGYTYGIGSGVSQNLQSGYFFIGTEVNKEYKDLAIEAIKEEVEKLQKEKIKIEELELVKNYLMGQLLQQSDGVHAMMERFLSVHLFDEKLTYFNELIQVIHKITAEDLQNIAQKYLNWEDFVIVSVG